MYDISDNRLRTKISKRLTAEAYERIQLSVFTGTVHPRDVAGLWSSLETWLAEEETAKFYVLKMTKKNFKNLEAIGNLEWDMDYLAGTKNSIFI